MIDPAIKKIRDEFIRGLGADLRAQGFDEKRIAWLLGPEAVAANGNEPTAESKSPMLDRVRDALRTGPLTIAQLASRVGSNSRAVRVWSRLNEAKGNVAMVREPNQYVKVRLP